MLTLSPVLLFVGCASHPAQYMTTEEKLYGTWYCEFSQQSESGSFSMSSEDTYVRNGRLDSFGFVSFRVPELPGVELEYSITYTADWEVQGKYIVQKIDDLKIINTSHPGLDDEFKFGDFFPENLSESSEIIRISETKLVLRSESDNGIYKCTR
jgi:hypothetical protein